MVMRETLDGFQGGLQIGEQIVTNLRYADDIILLATSDEELQELVDHLDRESAVTNTAYTHHRRQDQGIGERRHSVPHKFTHSE